MGRSLPPPDPVVPGEVVVRPDRPRYWRYFALRWVVSTAIVVFILVLPFVQDRPDNMRAAAVFGALMFGGIAAAVLRWQRRTYLNPEPALVMRADQLRILHKDRYLWIPWTDVASVRLHAIYTHAGVIDLLQFDLVPHAQGKLPPERASLVDRMMLWRTNDLVYSRPCDSPRIEEVERIAQRLHDQATGGHRLRAAQRAHWPDDLREGGS